MLIGKNVGNYRILAKTRFGESGTYYKAVHIERRQTYALKLLTTSLHYEDPAQHLFLEKLSIVQNLEHPHIARVFPMEFYPEFNVIPMEFIYGQNISEKVCEGPCGYDFAMKVAIQAADALIFAHEIGLVHERLTSNSLIVNAAGELKILDFGMCQLPPKMEAESGEDDIYTAFYRQPPKPPLSQLAYQAPEQVRGYAASEQTDLFSLGVILYELLVGEFLFEGDQAVELFEQILARELPKLSQVRPNASSSWNQVLQGLLEKNPSERYPSARELMNDLHKLNQGDVVERPGFRSKNQPISRRSFFRHFMGEREDVT